MIDLATLTGAMIVALGTTRPASSPPTTGWPRRCRRPGRRPASGLADAAGRRVRPRDRQRQCRREEHPASRFAGSIIAAVFLQRFVKDVPWAHLDIAGVVWSDKPSHSAATAPPARGAAASNPAWWRIRTSPERRQQEAASGRDAFLPPAAHPTLDGRCPELLEKCALGRGWQRGGAGPAAPTAARR